MTHITHIILRYRHYRVCLPKHPLLIGYIYSNPLIFWFLPKPQGINDNLPLCCNRDKDKDIYAKVLSVSFIPLYIVLILD